MKSTDSQLAAVAPSHRASSAVLLLVIAYALVLLSPIAFSSLRLAAERVAPSLHVAEWVPGTLAVGLALLGGAAMVTVLKRLVRELERSPYAGVAASFGVLMGSALIALRAPFHLGDLDSGACAVLCILLSITGGALALRPGVGSATVGGVIALAPGPLLLLLFSLQDEPSHGTQRFLYLLPQADRVFVGLVSLFGVLLWLVALVSRETHGARAQQRNQYWRPLAGSAMPEEAETTILLTRTKTAATYGRDFALAPTILSPLVGESASASEPTERVSVWSFHDAPPRPEDFELPPLTGGDRHRGLWLTLLALAAIAFTGLLWWGISRNG